MSRKRSLPHSATPASARLWPKLVLAFCSVLVAVLAFEVGLRVVSFWQSARERAAFEALTEARAVPVETVVQGPASLRDLIQRSENAKLIYELIPLLRADFKNAPVRTNSAGFRSGEVRAEKPPRTVRILGIGDSVMFGWGVTEEETFLSLLATDLNAHHPSVRWEIINTAVPGYNTAMEVETLATKGLRYAPDIVIVSMVGNDRRLPNFVWPEARTSGRWSLLVDRLFPRQDARGDGGLIFLDPAARAGEGWTRMPPAYRESMGWSGVERALRRLTELESEHHFTTIVTPYLLQRASGENGWEQEGVEGMWRGLGLTVVDAYEAAGEQLTREGLSLTLDDLRQSSLVLAPNDIHPSPLGHRLIADALLAHIEAKLVTTLLAATRSRTLQPPRRTR